MPYKDCVICKNKSFHIKTVDDWDIYKCENCGLEFTMPMPTEDILQNFYSNYYDIRQEADVSRKNAVKNINRLKKYGITKSDIHLLDIGCGGNYFTEYGTDRWMGYDKFIKDEIDIEDFEEYTWDFVTIWGTLEHITNPVELFKSLYKCMNDKAKIIFRVLTIESSIPYRYKPPEHVTYWTRKAIDILFEKTGFKLLECEPYTMIQNSDVYLECVLRTVPEEYKKLIYHRLPEFIEVPTNELYAIGEKK